MQVYARWLGELADKIEKGKKVHPCPKALRRVAALLPPPDDAVSSLTCETCGQACNSTANGDCHTCHEPRLEKWQAEMRVRQDPAQFDMRKLVNILLLQSWQHHCQIIPAYMPPYPNKETRPRCVVRYVYEDGSDSFLRHSLGPLQGYSWDMYGDDMMYPELALLALSQAIAPPRVGHVIPTHGS